MNQQLTIPLPGEQGAFRIDACRSCDSTALVSILDLGQQPIANELVAATNVAMPQAVFPLEVLFCEACSLLQVSETIPPATLFNADYPYFSSVIPTLMEHSRGHALLLIDENNLGADDLVVEIASNDGYLLRNFVAAGVPVLGIDPAAGPVAAANAAGVPTIEAFFGAEVARSLRAQGKRARIMLANNVLAHVDDINDFVAGFAILLADDGFIEFEFPYVRELVERCAFDTVYHEHIFYYSLAALDGLFARHGLYPNDATPVELHGGTLRLRVSRTPGKSEALLALEDDERRLGIDGVDYYRSFAKRVAELRDALSTMLTGIVADGKTIAAYGAAAKGATLLNYLDPPAGMIRYVVDLNPHKVGKYMPGVMLPILDVSELERNPPDYLLILPWNFADEIVAQQRGYAEAGGVFLRAVPRPERIQLT